MNNSCLICRRPLFEAETSQIGVKGLISLLKASQLRHDGLEAEFSSQTDIVLHTDCRKKYTRSSNIEAAVKGDTPTVSTPTDTRSRRSVEKVFDFRNHCLFCGEDANDSIKVERKYRKTLSKCETLDLQGTVRAHCLKRNDELSRSVLGRLDNVHDLPAAEGRYHRSCYKDFFHVDVDSNVMGRPVKCTQSSAFDKLCAYIDSSSECQYSTTELESILHEYVSDSGSLCDSYSTKHLKRKLQDHYGDKVTISSIPGKPCIFTFHEYSHQILHDRWYTERCGNGNDERKRVVETAARIIRQDIRAMVYDSSVYPDPKNITCIAPESLASFVHHIIDPGGKKEPGVKQEAIIQSIIAAIRPRSFISPLLLGIAVYIHRKYGSKELIELLNHLGFSESYLEVKRYEYSMMMNESDQQNPDGFLQYVFDNADFNIRTIDGHGTFHSMGGSQCTTPASNTNPVGVTERVLTLPKSSEIGKHGVIPIKTYNQPPTKALRQIPIKDPSENTVDTSEAERLDALWISGYTIQATPQPSWAGFMQSAMQNEGNYDVSEITALPFINNNPSDCSTLYTALCYAKSQCHKAGQKTCFVTFDQPLYIKSVEIVKSSPDLSGVVVRLGGFHLLMSFMGAMTYPMSGSGFQALWETVYAKNSVIQMLSGHAFNRALRAHFLTQQALAAILFKDSAILNENEATHLRETYEDVLRGESSIKDAVQDPMVDILTQRITALLDNTATRDRTAKLWVQYFHTVTLVRQFIRSERTGDWYLHLETIRKMLPLFHASGHLHYAKAAHLYHQEMCSLHDIMDKEEFQAYTQKGYFTIRRSDRFWAGVWSDMTIEQVLMRAMKVSGGLTRGRGITESTLAKWVRALPLCIPLCTAVEEFAGSHAESSEQHCEVSAHRDLRPAQQARDQVDLEVFISWLEAHPPFCGLYDGELVSLSTGVIGDSSINCYKAEEVGLQLQQQMVGNNFAEVKIKRNSKVKTLASVNSSIVVHEEEVPVSQEQLFNRIVCLLDGTTDLPSFLKYELAPRPPSLFDHVSMRRTAKAALSTLLGSLVTTPSHLPENVKFIVDGGHLLQSVVWPKPATYNQVCQNYVQFTIRHYRDDCKVKFDGYEQKLSTKAVEQSRRSSKKTSASMLVDGSMPTTTSQADFLSNAKNKGRLIKLLTGHLTAAGVEVEQAASDADTMIVSSALSEPNVPKAVVGTDTDLMTGLIARVPEDSQRYMLRPGSSNSTVFDIKRLQNALGELKANLLFLHSATGCDTTSALYNQGKKKAFKLLKANAGLAKDVLVFNMPNATKEELVSAGEKFLLHLYGGADFSSLDSFRYYAYTRAIAKKPANETLNLATLPPTSDAAKQHIFRTYLQVQQWLGNELDPTDWGWKVYMNTLVPVPTIQPPAPERLLNLISCKCKTGCSRGCGCRRKGALCSPMCVNCMGITCSNTGQSMHDDGDDDD